MGRGGFKELAVWQRSKDLAVQIYKTSSSGPLSKDHGLRDQLRRAAISIPSNLAEGDERDTDRDAVRFFYIAKGSVAELRTQLQIAFEIGYLDRNVFEKLDGECFQISRMIGALIKARTNTSSL